MSAGWTFFLPKYSQCATFRASTLDFRALPTAMRAFCNHQTLALNKLLGHPYNAEFGQEKLRAKCSVPMMITRAHSP